MEGEARAKKNLPKYVIVDMKDIQYSPNKKIKVEVEEQEEQAIPCRLCAKVFSNPMALRNHVRVLHMGEEADVEEWLQNTEPLPQPNPPKTKAEEKAKEQALIKQRREAIVSSMHSFDMADLVSSNVQYVIVQADELEANAAVRKRKEVKKEKIVKEVTAESDKPVTDPISGPFECLQPSSVFSAGVCHQIFFSCCEYSAHFRDEHSKRRKGNRCQVCEKLLINKDGQVQEFPYTCQVCGAGFNTHAELNAHTGVAHVKLKPYQCAQCKKRFTQQGGLQQHMRMHNGDRPYPCTFCAKAFTQKSGLEQHLRIHTKVKPYRCVICQKTFCQSIHLKQHMRTHTNVTPFQCAICEKKFKQASHLNYHLKNHIDSNMTDDQKKKYEELVELLKDQQNPQIVLDEEVTEQVVVDERGYILSDNGDETWTVMVEDEGAIEEEILS